MKNSSAIQPEKYEVRIQGILNSAWSEWLGCTDVTHTADETILSCSIQDQAALHSLLTKFRDMNLKILSVNRVEFKPDQNETKSKEGGLNES